MELLVEDVRQACPDLISRHLIFDRWSRALSSLILKIGVSYTTHLYRRSLPQRPNSKLTTVILAFRVARLLTLRSLQCAQATTLAYSSNQSLKIPNLVLQVQPMYERFAYLPLSYSCLVAGYHTFGGDAQLLPLHPLSRRPGYRLEQREPDAASISRSHLEVAPRI
jgi:hypothetical protein